jgi:Ca-activated chloride channel family protein
MMRYAAFESFFWIWLVPGVAVVLIFGHWYRQGATARFAGRASVARLAGQSNLLLLWIKGFFVVAAVALVIFALAQPQWGKYWTTQRAMGRDILVAIDVSRSMLADDVTPSRLERAKADVRDLASAVEEASGHRLGLIAFAGTASLKCPLTQVVNHFRVILDGLDTRSVARGGTMIGDCIRQAIEAYDDKTQNFRDLILITDGEDMDSFPHEAAAAARDAGITIYTIGLGDPAQGSRIAVQDKAGQRSFLEHEGQIVWSKLDERTLKDIAQTTGGAYIPAGTRAIELDRIFREVIEPKSKRDMNETQRERMHHRFQWFLAPAAILLLLDSLLRNTRKKPGPAPGNAARTPSHAVAPAHGKQSLLPATGLLAMLLIALSPPAFADDAGSLVRQGIRLYEAGKYAEAGAKFGEAANLAPTSPIPLFNQAAAQFQAGDYAGAAKLYEQARIHAPTDLRQRINYALGNCHLQQAMQSQNQPAQASQQAKTATEFYRDAIDSPATARSNSTATSDAARYNLELAKRLIQLMQQQQQQEQQRQDGDKKQQDQSQSEKTEDQSKDSQPQQKEGAEEPQGDEKKQGAEQAAQGDSSDQPPRPMTGQADEKLTPDDAAERLRAAIARAQTARARRLTEQEKRAKAKAVDRDW